MNHNDELRRETREARLYFLFRPWLWIYYQQEVGFWPWEKSNIE